jgi:thiol-disulfide isomerase/thioredoxin
MKQLFTLLISGLISISLFSQVEKKVIVEHFTNTRCSVCASQNPGLFQVLDDYPDVLHIAYHPSSPYPDCQFNQHNPQENDNRAYFYDVYGATPRAVLSGEVIPFQSPMVKPEQIDAQLNGNSDYKLTMTKNEMAFNGYKITMEIERVSGDEFETILVYAGLAEKEVNYQAPNGEDLHHDVFRKVIFFDTVSINPVGQKKIIEYEYNTNTAWDENQIYAFSIIHNYSTNQVIQAGSSLEEASGIGQIKINELSSVLFPNPGSGIFNMQPEYRNQFNKIEFYDLLGNRVKEFVGTSHLDIRELPEGLYFVKLTAKADQRVYSTRVIKINE